MGGIVFLAALPMAILLVGQGGPGPMVFCLVALANGLIGLLDDWIIVLKKRSLGLKARHKLLGQAVIALALYGYVIRAGHVSTKMAVPFLGSFDLGWGYLILVFCVLAGTTNAVNLTDGQDGLASGVMAGTASFLGLAAWSSGYHEMALCFTALVGVSLGFLWHNAPPARIFMGDTGSLALGGALAAGAILMKMEIWLLLFGWVFVLETLSVILQVISFKTTGKRIFRMSPLHHHFELGGTPESLVTVRFWIANILAGAFCLYLYMSQLT